MCKKTKVNIYQTLGLGKNFKKKKLHEKKKNSNP